MFCKSYHTGLVTHTFNPVILMRAKLWALMFIKIYFLIVNLKKYTSRLINDWKAILRIATINMTANIEKNASVILLRNPP